MSDESRQPLPIQHDETERVFYIEENQNQLAYIRYRAVASESEQSAGLSSPRGEIDFYTTYVAPESRGRGIAKRLVDHALDWAESNNYVIHASCWYAADLLAARN